MDIPSLAQSRISLSWSGNLLIHWGACPVCESRVFGLGFGHRFIADSGLCGSGAAWSCLLRVRSPPILKCLDLECKANEDGDNDSRNRNFDSSTKPQNVSHVSNLHIIFDTYPKLIVPAVSRSNCVILMAKNAAMNDNGSYGRRLVTGTAYVGCSAMKCHYLSLDWGMGLAIGNIQRQ